MKQIENSVISYKNSNKAERAALLNAPAALVKSLHYSSCLSLPLNKQLVLFECDGGAGIADLPLYLYNLMQANKQYATYTFVWAVKKSLLKNYAKNDAFHLVAYGSAEYRECLATAGYLITNTFFPSYFAKRPEQIFLNTTTGLPTTKTGYDDDNDFSPHLFRNFLNSSYIVSESAVHTEQILKNTYKLDGIYNGTVLELGDLRKEYLDTLSPSVVSTALSSAGVDLDKKLVLTIVRNRSDIAPVKELLTASTDSTYEHLVLEYNNFLYENIDFGCLVKAADVLITTGCIYDHYAADAATTVIVVGKSNHHYQPNSAYGDFSVSTFKAAADILATLTVTVQKQGQSDDHTKGNALLSHVFSATAVPSKIKTVRFSDKKKILFHLNLNQQSEQLKRMIHFLNFFDYQKYDVTLYSPVLQDPFAAKQLTALDPHVRIYYSRGYTLLPEQDYLDFRYLSKIVFNADHPSDVLEAVKSIDFDHSWRRQFGTTEFDSLVQVGPLSAPWTLFFASQNIKKSSLQLSSEIFDSEDQQLAYLATYDKIVCCCEAVYNAFDDIDGFHDSAKLHPFYDVLDYSVIDKDDPITTEFISYKDTRYAIIDKPLEHNDTRFLTILPAPIAACKNFVVSGHHHNAQQLKDLALYLRQLPDAYKLFSYSSDDSDSTIYTDISADVIFSNDITLLDFSVPHRYFSQFDGYIQLDEQQHRDALKQLFVLLDKPVYFFVNTVTETSITAPESHRTYVVDGHEQLTNIFD